MKKDKKGGLWSSIQSLFSTLFSIGKSKSEEELETMIEDNEGVTSPTKQIAKNFFSNKLGVIGLVSFILIFVTVFGVSATMNYDRYIYEPSLANVGPGQKYLSVPKDAQGKEMKTITSGSSFTFALDTSGKVYFWGQSPAKRYPVDAIIEKIGQKKVKDIAAGSNHVIALTSDNRIIGAGNNNFNQTELKIDLMDIDDRQNIDKGVAKIGAGQDISVLLTDNGYLYPWGSVMNSGVDEIPEEYQGHIVDFEIAPYSILLKLDDGTIGVIGNKSNAIAAIPQEFKDGTNKVEQISVSKNTAAAIDVNGKLHTWGSVENGLLDIPAEAANMKFKKVTRTLTSFSALTEDGKVITWGTDRYNVLKVPSAVQNGQTTDLYSDAFQIYAIDGSNKITSWGNKGALLGTDSMGRDIAERLIQGGRISLTVGAISMLISTVIGVLAGLVAGYYGGFIDNLIMRFAEVISAFPFMPLAITLSALLPSDTPEMQRIGLIMVIQGVLMWPGVARLVRGQILAEREKDFVLAARALGLRESTIMLKHILPSVFNFIIVSMTLGYAGSLLSEAGLSYLGFGVVPPSPSWGNMLTGVANTTVIEHYWWQWVLPALCVMLTALSVNFIGDAMRDAMDPKSNRK